MRRKIALWFSLILILSIIIYTAIVYLAITGASISVDAQKVPEITEFQLLYETNFIPITLFSLLSVFLLSFTGSVIATKLTLKPIENLRRTAENISVRNLNQRLPYLPGSDEFARLSRTLNSMVERLDRQFRQIRQFTSDASHELKTPLTILKGELEIAMMKQRETSDYMRVLASSHEEVVRLQNVVEDLLEISKAESGQLKLTFTRQNLSTLVLDIVEDAEVLAEKKNISVKHEIEDGIIMLIDSSRMHQALLNLVDNGIKYGRENGFMFIGIKKENSFVKLIFRDNGIGISEEKLPFIFDRFFRADDSRNRRTKGTGLGLSIVKWIIESHKGTINVKSSIGKGTEFLISLPLD